MSQYFDRKEMQMMILFQFCVFFLMLMTTTRAYGNAKMPFMAGENWRCSQGNNAPHADGFDHWSEFGIAWAWDFSLAGSRDLGAPVLSPEKGLVVHLIDTCDYCIEGWGNQVIIQIQDGNFIRLSHFQDVFIRLGE